MHGLPRRLREGAAGSLSTRLAMASRAGRWRRSRPRSRPAALKHQDTTEYSALARERLRQVISSTGAAAMAQNTTRRQGAGSGHSRVLASTAHQPSTAR
jgi:hypothetical protein